MTRSHVIALPFLCAWVSACAPFGGLNRSESLSSISPKKTTVAEVPVKGFLVHVYDRHYRKYEGELLAVADPFIYVLTETGEIGIRLDEVDHVEVVFWETKNVAGVALWSALGGLSTVTHGLFAVITLPVWLVTGAAVTGNAAYINETVVKPEDLPKLSQFARYPQGMPVQRSSPEDAQQKKPDAKKEREPDTGVPPQADTDTDSAQDEPPVPTDGGVEKPADDEPDVRPPSPEEGVEDQAL